MTCVASPKLGKGRHKKVVCPMIGHTRSSGIILGSVSLQCSRTRCRSASHSCGGTPIVAVGSWQSCFLLASTSLAKPTEKLHRPLASMFSIQTQSAESAN